MAGAHDSSNLGPPITAVNVSLQELECCVLTLGKLFGLTVSNVILRLLEDARSPLRSISLY